MDVLIHEISNEAIKASGLGRKKQRWHYHCSRLGEVMKKLTVPLSIVTLSQIWFWWGHKAFSYAFVMLPSYANSCVDEMLDKLKYWEWQDYIFFM